MFCVPLDELLLEFVFLEDEVKELFFFALDELVFFVLDELDVFFSSFASGT